MHFPGVSSPFHVGLKLGNPFFNLHSARPGRARATRAPTSKNLATIKSSLLEAKQERPDPAPTRYIRLVGATLPTCSNRATMRWQAAHSRVEMAQLCRLPSGLWSPSRVEKHQGAGKSRATCPPVTCCAHLTNLVEKVASRLNLQVGASVGVACSFSCG